jgi:two-component system chemotaxis response regulator CheY
MDGIELIKALKATANAKYTPMLVITTESGDGLKAKGREAGASGWMTKPFSPDTLIKAVAKLTTS